MARTLAALLTAHLLANFGVPAGWPVARARGLPGIGLRAGMAAGLSLLLLGCWHAAAAGGWLERALVMLLVLIGRAADVGFLITARSILRFGDVRDSQQRKATEYVIIGTFMSFGWGLLIAISTQRGVLR